MSDDETREYDLAEIIGPYAWGILHHVVETFPCNHCSEEGGRLLRGLHDLVNHKTGKPLMFPADFQFLADMANTTAEELGLSATEPMPLADLEREVSRLARATGLLSANASLEQQLLEVEAKLDSEDQAERLDPTTKLVKFVKRSGNFKGEIVDFTPDQYEQLIGLRPRRSIIKSDGKVPWELALDVVADEMGFEHDEDLKKAVEKAVARRRRIDRLRGELAGLLDQLPKCNRPENSFVPCPEFPDQDCRHKLMECDGSQLVAIRHPSQWTIHDVGDDFEATEDNQVAVARLAKETTRLMGQIGRTPGDGALSSARCGEGLPHGRCRGGSAPHPATCRATI